MLFRDPCEVRDGSKADPRPVVKILEDALQRSEPTNEVAEMVGFSAGRLANERALDLSNLFRFGLVEEQTGRR